MENENGLVKEVSTPTDVKSKGIRYVVANTVEAVKELITKRERGEIFSYRFVALRRNGDRVFAVKGGELKWYI